MACRVHPTKIGPMLDAASVARVRKEAFALISQGYSKLSLQERLGLTRGSAKGYIDRFRLKAKAEAVPLPPCRCGGPHNHLGHCIEKRHGCPTGLRPIPDDFITVAPTLTRKGIVRHYHTSPSTRERWLREVPEVQPRVMIFRTLRPVARSSSPVKDDLYAEIDRLVPVSIADDVRSDIISELYLAVLDGSVPRDRLAEKGGAVLNRTVDFCGHGRHGPLSLDIMFDKDGNSFLDLLEDESASDAFDRIFDDDDMH